MFEQLDELQKTPHTEDDAQCECYDHEVTTFDRPELWVPTIIAMFVSGGFLFAFADRPYGMQLGSLIPYTAFMALGTFSAVRGLQPFFFECPIVQGAMLRVLGRHSIFLSAIVLLETIALRLTRYMPESWLAATGRGGSPFGETLCAICMCVALVQVFTN